MTNVYGKTEFSGTMYVIDESETMVYKLDSFNQMSMSNDFGLSVDMTLVAGWEYIDIDYSDKQGWLSKEGFTEDVQFETFTFYPMVENLKEALEEAGFKPISHFDVSSVHEFKVDDNE